MGFNYFYARKLSKVCGWLVYQESFEKGGLKLLNKYKSIGRLIHAPKIKKSRRTAITDFLSRNKNVLKNKEYFYYIIFQKELRGLSIKAQDLLDELQKLDIDIKSRMDEINELEAGLLSSPKFQVDKVSGGKGRKVDDVYTQLVVMKEAIEQDTAEIIDRKLELSRKINQLKDPKQRTVLRLTYIVKKHVLDICNDLDGISIPTYYRLKRSAISELDKILSDNE